MKLLSSKWLSVSLSTVVLAIVFVADVTLHNANPGLDQAFLYALGLWFGNLGVVVAKNSSNSPTVVEKDGK